jgi:hypothetical protein
VGRGAACEEGVVVGVGSGGDGVVEFDDAFGVDEDGGGAQGVVVDVLFLEVAQGQDAAGEDGPELLLCEPAFLEQAFVDLVLEGPLGELPEGVEFEEGHAELVLFAGDEFDEGEYMSVVCELFLFVSVGGLYFLEGLFIVAADFSQQKLFLVIFALEVAHALLLALLYDLELLEQAAVLFASLR